jgi:hypothetical protein
MHSLIIPPTSDHIMLDSSKKPICITINCSLCQAKSYISIVGIETYPNIPFSLLIQDSFSQMMFL